MNRSGRDFEEIVLGRRSVSGNIRKYFEPESKLDFSRDVFNLISKTKKKHPSTRISKALFDSVKSELTRRGIKTHGLTLIPTVGGKFDVCYFTDALFYLPAIGEFPLTIDLFNIELEELNRLKSVWIDSFSGNIYSPREFQSDLYRFNIGLFCWKNEDIVAKEHGLTIPVPRDLRTYKVCARPENHFILTPDQALNYKGRRRFAKILVNFWFSKAKPSSFSKGNQTSS